MRVGVKIFALWCLLAPAVLPAAERTPHELYDAINSLRVDPSSVYQIAPRDRLELRRGDAVLSFEEGRLAFFAPLDGQVTGAVFSGRGHALALLRDPVEKQQMGLFLGAPVLDQDFITAYMRFTDDSADDLLRQLKAANIQPQTDLSFTSRWDQALLQLNPLHTLRILLDRFTKTPKPYFYAGLEGVATSAFDVALDDLRDEQFLLGQVHKGVAGSYYNVWTAHKMPGSPALERAFHALHYAIETSILLNNSLDSSATVRLRAETGTQQFATFQLSRSLVADHVEDEKGNPLPFFQNEGMSPQQRAARGADYVYVILPDAPQSGREFTLKFHYAGNVIQDSGNGVLFVAARESWYPHHGDPSEFATYDLTMRWPRRLRLVATGTKIDEREDGESRFGHWQTEKPVAVAGFNLGDYVSASFASGVHSIDVYANRQLEQALKERLAAPDSGALIGRPSSYPRISASEGAIGTTVLPNLPPPSPADALKQLGKEIDSSIRFYETFSGPFPFRDISVSQIPGTFAQGWPGLLYLSTYSYLPQQAQERAGLSTSGQEHFTELVPFHEVAHQWWGNVVGWSSYRDQWIDEGLAHYLALLFADTQKNPEHTLRIWLQRFRQRLLEKSPGTDAPRDSIGAIALGARLNSSKFPAGYEEVTYTKGAWIFHMLREMLRQPGSKNPDARFIALLHTLAAKYAYRALSADDLQHEVEAVMTPGMELEGGHSMEWFFEEWVRGTGIPHYRVEFTVHHNEKGYLVRGKLLQTGVPHSFIASVPLYADGGSGHSTPLLNVVAAGPETPFQILVPAPPRKILVDPRMTLLCTSE